MAKRLATNDLNTDKCDEKGEPEDAKPLATNDLNTDKCDEKGETEDRAAFNKAAEDKRLVNELLTKLRAEYAKSDFSGFKNKTSYGTSSRLGSSAAAPISFLGGTSSTGVATTNFTFTSTSAAAKKFKFDNTHTNISPTDAKLQKLKLNRSVSEWIKTQVDANPYCLLSPIFKDYDNYLQQIEEEQAKFKKSITGALEKETQSTGKATNTVVPFSGFTFSTAASITISNDPDDSTTDSMRSTTKSFTFGNKLEKESFFTPFKLGSNYFKYISECEKNRRAICSSRYAPSDEDGEYEPPKVEYKQVVEEDAVYSKKCEVLVKKDGNYVDYGVGILYLKPVKDSEKMQLLVRDNTNHGNILINLILSQGLRVERLGVNNVMMVCVPSPYVGKATTILFCSKSSEDADDLCATLQKYTK